MFVAISGSQGCGKTTVINALKEKGYNVIERKTSRSILEEWGVTLQQVNNDHELTTRFQDEIIRRKAKDEEQARRFSNEVWFTERTYADLFTYALVSLGKENQYSVWLSEYHKRCMVYQQSYDYVYYLKGGLFTIEHDGVRGSNHFYQRMVDLTMLDITQQMVMPHSISVIETPHLEERIAMISTQIAALQRKDMRQQYGD